MRDRNRLTHHPFVARTSVVLIGAVLVLLAALPVSADTLLFKDGRKLQGRVVSREGGTITFDSRGTLLKLPASSVASVESSQSNPLADAERNLRAARYDKAYEAYQVVLNDQSTDDATRRLALAAQNSILTTVTATTEKDWPALAAADHEGQTLQSLEERTRLSKPDTFDGIVVRRQLSDLRVAVARKYIDRSLYAEAMKAMRPDEPLAAASPAYRAVLGALYVRQTDWKLAAEQLKLAIEGNPLDFAALNNLFHAMAELVDVNGIVDLWKTRPEGFDTSDLFDDDTRGLVSQALRLKAVDLVDAGNKADAIGFYETGIFLVKPTADLYTQAADFYAKIGDTAKADKMKTLARNAQRVEQDMARVNQAVLRARAQQEAAMRAAAAARAAQKKAGGGANTNPGGGRGNAPAGGGARSGG